MQSSVKKKSFGEILRTEPLVLVDFSAEWCGPCKMMKPILDELKSEVKEQLVILKLDVDKNPHAASAYNIQSVPTLILFKNGKNVYRQSGVVQKNELLRLVRQFAV